MSIDAKAVANYFLGKSRQSGTPLTQMQIQKLVYIAHGYHLAITGAPLIDDEVEAWPFGPVIRSLYGPFMRFGNLPVTEQACDEITGEIPTVDAGDQSVRLLDRVWDVYSGIPGVKLSNLTHQEKTPWSQTIEDPTNRGVKKPGIPNRVIRDYYRTEMLGPKK